jgi:hypothetical protein
MFLMTGGLDTQGYWWDRLERIIMKARALPPVLSVSVSERTLGIPTEGIYRREVYLAAWKHLRVADVRARDEAVDTLGDTLGVLAVDMELRPATTAEVEERKGSIFVGGGAHPRSPEPAFTRSCHPRPPDRPQQGDLPGPHGYASHAVRVSIRRFR